MNILLDTIKSGVSEARAAMVDPLLTAALVVWAMQFCFIGALAVWVLCTQEGAP